VRRFEHLSPASLEEAAAALSTRPARAMAGGTDVLGELKDEIHAEYPQLVVDLKTIAGLDYVRSDQEGLRIGALTKLATVADDPVVTEGYPALALAAASVASPQIRQMATVAGNICQSTRCWYYWVPDDRFHCMRKGGNACFALAGDNRYHSVFGGVRFRPTPCVSACPVGTEIPSYVGALQKEGLAAAARRIMSHNPMPAITGRVCPHFCEAECNRSQVDESVSIRAVERAVGDFLLSHWEEVALVPGRDTGKGVAVVGAGPAGLSAAYYLRMQGHEVTVLDRFDRPGGMLNHSIPRYRLPEEIVDRHVEILRGLGISFRPGVEVGSDISLQDLRDEHDAVFLATGTWEERELGIGEGTDVISGLEYLRQARTGNRGEASGHVLVIGGGNVAIDVARTAKRLGAERVTLACLESLLEMPAIRSEIDEAVEEGIEILPSCGPARLVPAGRGAVGMELVACTSVFDAAGAFAPSFDVDSRTTVGADTIVVAIGQRPDLSVLRRELPESAFERGLIEVDQTTQETVVPGLYAGGDATSGPGFVVGAIAAGRRAALAIDRYLGADGGSATSIAGPEEYCPSFFASDNARVAPPRLAADLRNLATEDVGGLTSQQARVEASRCMDCSCVSVNGSDLAPVLIALGARIETTKRIISAEDFFAVDVGTSTVLEEDELITEVRIPRPAEGSRSSFIKFALRNSIDFPLVSCAVAIAHTAGVTDSASICLNAVYGRPYVAVDAEEFLVGRQIDPETAATAGELAAKGGVPLSGSAYKLRIARALVERCILACSTGAPRG
jgi:NADPH-dependent glutamate synthase beta subunit-like oxidoreductase